MKVFFNLARVGALLAAAASLSAQAPGSFTFKMGGGPLGGQAKGVFGNAGYTVGADLEYTTKFGSDSRLVYGFGYRYLPGDNDLLSFIPFSIAATNVNPSYYETRNRKAEGQTFHIAALYRQDAWLDGVYWQGGLRLGRTRVKSVDTGTRITTNGQAISNTTTTTPSANILAIDSIATNESKASTAITPVLGVGYRFGDKYALELNAANVTVSTPKVSSKSGLSFELSFSVTF